MSVHGRALSDEERAKIAAGEYGNLTVQDSSTKQTYKIPLGTMRDGKFVLNETAKSASEAKYVVVLEAGDDEQKAIEMLREKGIKEFTILGRVGKDGKVKPGPGKVIMEVDGTNGSTAEVPTKGMPTLNRHEDDAPSNALRDPIAYDPNGDNTWQVLGNATSNTVSDLLGLDTIAKGVYDAADYRKPTSDRAWGGLKAGGQTLLNVAPAVIFKPVTKGIGQLLKHDELYTLGNALDEVGSATASATEGLASRELANGGSALFDDAATQGAELLSSNIDPPGKWLNLVKRLKGDIPSASQITQNKIKMLQRANERLQKLGRAREFIDEPLKMPGWTPPNPAEPLVVNTAWAKSQDQIFRTYVHEVMHARRMGAGTFEGRTVYEEFLAFIDEFRWEVGRAPTRREAQYIYEQALDSYQFYGQIGRRPSYIGRK